ARGRLLQRGGWSSKAFFALLVAFAGWFIFGSTDYEVSVPCTVAPAEVRGFGAPADGILRRAQVVPGDRVLKGEVLCEFDDRELRLERERLVAELNTAALDESKALSEGDRVGARLARVKEDELRSLLDIVKLKIEQSVIRAPFDGEIVNGDLRERVGDLLLKGEPLFELSADRGWLIELRIPEAEIAGFVVGLEGRFATHARPEEGRSIRITRSPRAPSSTTDGPFTWRRPKPMSSRSGSGPAWRGLPGWRSAGGRSAGSPSTVSSTGRG
ncbi:MAG: HlyD family efflux transporter periplasmic adaptor subunit, partial [Planctomycetota bacterium]